MLLCQHLVGHDADNHETVYWDEAEGKLKSVAWSESLQDSAEDVRNAVRMRLDERAMRYIKPLLDSKIRLMASARHLFCPAGLTWIETPGPVHDRIGMLLWASDENLQRGMVIFYVDTRPCLVALSYEFDLRRPQETMAWVEKGWRRRRREMMEALGGRFPEARLPPIGDLMATMVAVLAFLSSPRVHARNLVTFDKLNKARARQGKWPLLAYHEVTINLASVEERTNVHTGTGSPRALHFVRAHLRLCWSGIVVLVLPHWRGDGSLGIKRPAYRLTA
jgi:hypothetical protein